MSVSVNKLREVTLLCDHKFNESTHYSLFRLAPFSKGQALPVASILRRILLQELDSFAITNLNICTPAHITHEFHLLPGIRESLPEIFRNLQNVIFSVVLPSNIEDTINNVQMEIEQSSPHIPLSEISEQNMSSLDLVFPVSLKAEGKTILTAGDIFLPPWLKIVNPSQHIATLVSPHAKLDLNFSVSHAKTYMSCIQQLYPTGFQNENMAIPIESSFSPVQRVNYFIKHEQSYEFLLFEVWTNGSITPSQALGKTSLLLKQLFQPFI